MRRGANRNSVRFLAPCVAFALFCAPAIGSTVVPMAMEQLADTAAQVVTGRVASVRSYWAGNPRRIESEVTFDAVGFLKGAPRQASSTYQMVVPGGKIGERQMRLCCAPQFRIGETWILFVLPEYKTFPVVGLHRGAFRTAKDAQGVERVLTSDGLAVTGIDNGGFIIVAGGNVDPHTRLLGAINAEIRTPTAQRLATPPISLRDFLSEIQPILDASRDHQLTGTAGKRIPIIYTPVGLSLGASAGQSHLATSDTREANRRSGTVERKVPPPSRAARKSGDRR